MKTPKLFLAITFFFIIGVMSIQAQDDLTIQGVIWDVNDEAPLMFAQVVVHQGERFISGTVADLDGRFQINNLSPGKYQLRASFLGFKTQTKEVLVAAHTEMDFDLSEQALVLETVEIIAYKCAFGICDWGCVGIVTCTDCFGPLDDEDMDDEEEQSDMIEIKQEATFYPNPSAGQVNFKSEVEISEMELRDISGKLIWTKRVDGSKGSLDLSGMETGYYVVRYVEGGVQKSRKLVKVSY